MLCFLVFNCSVVLLIHITDSGRLGGIGIMVMLTDSKDVTSLLGKSKSASHGSMRNSMVNKNMNKREDRNHLWVVMAVLSRNYQRLNDFITEFPVIPREDDVISGFSWK